MATIPSPNSASSLISNLFKGNPVEGTVFGSYELQYPVDDIERERDDGVTIIDIKPETRVFVCGGEITQDVIDVSIDRQVDNDSTCSIKIANPRGKYNVTLQDLMGNWREDKDILATYDYDWIKNNFRDDYDKINNIIKYATGDVLATQIQDLVKNAAPKRHVVPITKMIFDVKHASGITKKEGDLIFDYRDPVYVFMKGRFSPYWYFAFTGTLAEDNEQNRYGNDQTFNIRCQDVLYLLKRKRYYERGSLLAGAASEASVTNREFTNITQPYTTTSKPTATNLLKYSLIRQEPNPEGLDKIKNLSFFSSNQQTPDITSVNIATGINPYGYGDIKEYSTQMNIFQDTHSIEYNDSFIPEMYRTWDLLGNITNKITKSGKLIDFGINFIYDSFTILVNTDENKQQIEKFLMQIVEIKKNNTPFKIYGFTDGWGSYNYSMSLSSNRVIYLLSYLGIGSYVKYNPNQVIALGYPNEYNLQVVADTYKSITGLVAADYNINKLNLCKNNDNKSSIEKGMGTREFPAAIPGPDGVHASAYYVKNGNIIPNCTFDTFKGDATIAGVGFGGLAPITSNNSTLHPSPIPGTIPLKYSGGTPNVYDLKNRRVSIQLYTVTTTSEIGTTLADFTNFVRVKKPHLADPDIFPLSYINSPYFQWNEVAISLFKEPVIRYNYDTLVRYWAREYSLDQTQFGIYNRTGWKQSGGFGISGIHPALTNDFIDNFNILPGVWDAITDGKGNITKDVDDIVVRPLDKIRESVFGSPTEISSQYASTKNSPPAGTEFNYFRPRIIFLKPLSHASMLLPLDISKFLLFDIKTSTTYDYLVALCKQMDFTFYTTPMGDIIIEPKMYDMHPLEFMKNPQFPIDDYSLKAFDKIEKRNIVKKGYQKSINEIPLVGKPIYFRNVEQLNPDGTERIGFRPDFAYNFNSKANHPFFIMEKDRTDFNDTFNSDMLKTSLTVIGMPFSMGNSTSPPFGSLITNLNNFLTTVGKITVGNNTDVSKDLISPIPYIADGFVNSMRNDAISKTIVKDKLKDKFNSESNAYSNNLYNGFNSYKDTETSILSLIQNSKNAMTQLSKDNHFVEVSDFGDLLVKFTDGTLAENAPTTGIYSKSQLDKNNLDAETLNYLQIYAPELYSVLNYQYTNEILKESILAQSAPEGATSASLQDYLKFPIYHFFNINETIEIETTNQFQLDLINLYKPIYITLSVDNKSKYLELMYTYNMVNTEYTGRILTLGDFKQLEKLGLYNPNKDLVTRYGILSAGEITNLFVANGQDAINYGKIMFNRFLSEAHQFRISCIGRPEFMLNRPYYVELKKAIGLSKSHSISWSFNAEFMSTVELTYIRKNAITYSFNKSNIDEIAITDPTKIDGTNEDFYNEAKKYYSSMKTMQGLQNLTNKANDTLTAGVYNNINFSAGGLVALAAGGAVQVGASIAQTAIEDNYPQGGIYVAHDWIGHLNFDQTGKAALNNDIIFGKSVTNIGGGILTQPTTQSSASYPLGTSKLGNYFISINDGQILTSFILTLNQQLSILEDIEIDWLQAHLTLISYKDQYKTTSHDVDTFDTNYKKDPSNENNLKYLKAVEELNQLEKNINTQQAIIEQKKYKHSLKTIDIYGQANTVSYNPSNDKRTGNTWNYYSNTSGGTTITTGAMADVYSHIPVLSVDKLPIRSKYTIVDDKNADGTITIGNTVYPNFIKLIK